MGWAQRSHYDRKTLIAENNLAEAKVSDRARQQKQRARDDPSKP